jgi:hypothetical protein
LQTVSGLVANETNEGIVSQGKDYEADGGRQISQQLDWQHRSFFVFRLTTGNLYPLMYRELL